MSEHEWGLIVLGGGISGLGIARQAALAGLRPLVLERQQVCRATSDNSLRILHGGLRYLQTLDLPRIRDSIRDQAYWLKEAAGYVRPLVCLLPCERWGFKSKLPLLAAAQLYRGLYRCLGKSKYDGGVIEHPEKSALDLPFSPDQFRSGLFSWQDALITDQRGLADFVAQTITGVGGEIWEGAEVHSVKRAHGGFSVLAQMGGAALELKAKVVVNALGPWLHRIERPDDVPRSRSFGWCKAFNLVLSRQFHAEAAFGVTADLGRVFFIVPRGEGSVIGTYYVPFDGHPDNLQITDKEVGDFVAAIQQALPAAAISAADVVEVEAGVLPVKSMCRGVPKLYGAERIYDYNGYIEVLSTKYTTFRSQGAKVLKLVMQHQG